MKKLAITSVAVLIALCGFIAILWCLPCEGECCGGKEGCEWSESKCSGEKEGCEKGDAKCSDKKEACGKDKGHHRGGHEGCGKGQGHHKGGHDGCGGENEKCTVKEWKDADGNCHKEVKVIVGGDRHCGMGMGCPMDGDHSGCCGCCMMKYGGGDDACCDSAKSDSIRYKVRGKL